MIIDNLDSFVIMADTVGNRQKVFKEIPYKIYINRSATQPAFTCQWCLSGVFNVNFEHI